ncbi:hypothetical protein U8P71_17355 [Rhizobium ruizarguesonis]|nr:hypothetical protein U8P71_17355 [Rhizobium ruizarguesonis]
MTAEKLLANNTGLRADIYWARSDDRDAAVAGKFSARSTTFALPTKRLKEPSTPYRFEEDLIKARFRFAWVVLEDAKRVEEFLGRDKAVTVYNNSALWNEFSNIPDEDFDWANAEIRAREQGRPPVPHPHPEIGFMIWLTYKANLMDGAAE